MRGLLLIGLWVPCALGGMAIGAGIGVAAHMALVLLGVIP